VLEDHRHVLASEVAQPRIGHGPDILAIKQHIAG
jgi:hypothetical protein